jgi:hypothetical protein
LKSHKLKRLAKEKAKNNSLFVFSCEKLIILDNLRPYIKWAGRYPIPLNENQYAKVMHSSVDMDLEIRLWERLHAHLKAIGWVMKGKDRLFLTPRDDSADTLKA